MPQVVTTEKKKRFGLMRVRVESNHILKMGDGKTTKRMQVTARDRSRFPEAKTVCVCVYCRDHRAENWKFKSERELVAAHPTRAVMVKSEEAHVYFWWSDDPDPGKLSELEAETEAKLAELEGQLRDAPKEEVTRRKAQINADHTRLVAALPRIGMLTDDDQDGVA